MTARWVQVIERRRLERQDLRYDFAVQPCRHGAALAAVRRPGTDGTGPWAVVADSYREMRAALGATARGAG